MNNELNITINMDNLTEEDREQLTQLVNKASKHKKIYEPKYGENYWTINGFGDIVCYCSYNDEVDQYMQSIGACFRTRSEAAHYKELLQVIHELRKYADEHNKADINWEDVTQPKCYITYSHSDDELYVYTALSNQCCNDIYFDSIAVAEGAIKQVGKDRILRYLFDIDV